MTALGVTGLVVAGLTASTASAQDSTLRSDQAVTRSCFEKPLTKRDRGVALHQVTSTVDGLVQARLRPHGSGSGDWDVAVFDNRFPSLGGTPAEPPALIVPAAPATGHCEVVVFTRDAKASLGGLPLWHIELLLQVWGDRTERLARRGDIAYVLPFENRGAEVGVTLHHPHGQIYAYPVVPPVPARMQELALRHQAEHGRGPLAQLIEDERRDGRRLVYEGPHAVAFVPVCARYPYEVWVAPIEAGRPFFEAALAGLLCAVGAELLFRGFLHGRLTACAAPRAPGSRLLAAPVLLSGLLYAAVTGALAAFGAIELSPVATFVPAFAAYGPALPAAGTGTPRPSAGPGSPAPSAGWWPT